MRTIYDILPEFSNLVLIYPCYCDSCYIVFCRTVIQCVALIENPPGTMQQLENRMSCALNYLSKEMLFASIRSVLSKKRLSRRLKIRGLAALC